MVYACAVGFHGEEYAAWGICLWGTVAAGGQIWLLFIAVYPKPDGGSWTCSMCVHLMGRGSFLACGNPPPPQSCFESNRPGLESNLTTFRRRVLGMGLSP